MWHVLHRWSENRWATFPFTQVEISIHSATVLHKIVQVKESPNSIQVWRTKVEPEISSMTNSNLKEHSGKTKPERIQNFELPYCRINFFKNFKPLGGLKMCVAIIKWINKGGKRMILRNKQKIRQYTVSTSLRRLHQTSQEHLLCYCFAIYSHVKSCTLFLQLTSQM